jgi:hypothetical protein
LQAAGFLFLIAALTKTDPAQRFPDDLWKGLREHLPVSGCKLWQLLENLDRCQL